ncbi:unnamed protein product [Parajaminaea phylloscopi]
MQQIHESESKGSQEKYDVDRTGVHTFTQDAEVAQHKVSPDDGFDPAEIKRIRRKIDWRLVPPLAGLYALSLIDRTNLSLAAQAGMLKDLRLTVNDRYAHAVVAFFPAYIALELVSNLGLRKVGARWWLPTAGVCWGLALIGMGFVTNWQGLTALRAVLGIFEAALFPGATYLLGCWYLRREMATRLTSFFMVGVFASGVSAIFAYALALIETGKYRAWRWIFIGEGLISVVVAIACYWLIVDFPSSHRCTFLTEEEKRITLTRIERDRADAESDGLTWKKLGTYAIDAKLWAFSIMFGGTTLAGYALSYFMPRIITSMGIAKKPVEVYALIIPPYVAALPWALTLARISDRMGVRSPFVAINAALSLIGCGLFAFLPVNQAGARYFGLFLTTATANSNVPLISSWSQCSIRKQSKRAFASALVVGFGGLGGVVAGLIFREKDAPKYRFGMLFVMGASGVTVLLCAVLAAWFAQCNRMAHRGRKVIEGNKDFRYQL